MVDWGNRKVTTLIEIAGATTVILSLIFVGYELRQNTAAVQAATLQALTDGAQQYLHLLASNPELAAIRLKTRNSEELTDIEAERWRQLRRARWTRFQNAFSQFRRGTLDQEDWSYYEGFICDADPDEWDDHKAAMIDSFVHFVDTCLAKRDDENK